MGSACGGVPGTVRASECYRVHDEVTTHPSLHGVVTSETTSEIAPLEATCYRRGAPKVRVSYMHLLYPS